MNKLLSNYKTILLVVGSLITIFVFYFFGIKPLLDNIEILTYDWRTKLATDGGQFSSVHWNAKKNVFEPVKQINGIPAYKAADPNVVILSAEDRTFQTLANYPQLGIGRWPWKRQVFGDVVNFVKKGHPKAIVFDIKFEGAEGTEAEQVASDNHFASAIKEQPVILGMSLSAQRIGLKDDIENMIIANNLTSNDYVDLIISNLIKTKTALIPSKHFVSVDDSSVLKLGVNNDQLKTLFNNINYYNFSRIVDSFLVNAQGVGIINLNASENMVARYNVPLYRLSALDGNKYIPSLPLAAALSTFTPEERKNIKILPGKILIGKREIPIDSEGKTLINWHGKGSTYNTIPIAHAILSEAESQGKVKIAQPENRISPDIFKDKIVVIGQSSAGTDIHATPMAMAYPGPEIIATAIDNYINDSNPDAKDRRKFIVPVPFIVNFIILALFCSAVGIFNLRTKSIFMSIIWFLLLLCLFVLFATVIFLCPTTRLWINMSYPVLFMTLTAIGTNLYKIYTQEQEKKVVENLFGKFVSPQVLDKLLKDPKSINYSGQRKVMTVLFSDIRGFTTMSENISPDKIILQLNEYMTEMVEVVLNNNGTLDKYIGDAVMAFYGDPLWTEEHALNAVKTAVDMRKELTKLNERWRLEGRPVLDIGIGINTGEMVVGHMGSPRLVDYTVIGDNVNLASRLESLNKEYKTHIIISEYTYEQVKDQVNVSYLDEVKVKGKQKPVKIYNVIGLKD